LVDHVAMSWFRAGLLLCSFASFAGCQDPATVPGDAPDRTPSDFVRFVVEGDGGHLDTAITTYRKGEVTLQLFGAVHIADAACYQVLNDRFTGCEVLLYELVAAPDDRPGKQREERGFNPLSMLQQGLKNSLELSFQLDDIDYQAPNFVHADMTPQEFAASMQERGESMLSIMLNMMQSGMKMQREQQESGAAAEPFDLVKAFQKGEGRHTLRLNFAQQMEQIEALAIGGKEGSTLLEGRNEKCLEVLQRELRAGRKQIGIYYGAAHFPHMEKRLVEDLGFTKVGHEWVVAWDCKKRPDVKYDRALIKLRQQVRADLTGLGKAAKAWREANGGSELPTAKVLAAPVSSGEPRYAGPVQDPWGTDYVVRKRPVGSRWEVASAGQDRQWGTDDDLVEVEARRGGLFGR
jgi:Type II secretion system (T2SS), protein G